MKPDEHACSLGGLPPSPTPVAIRKGRKRAGLTQEQAGALVYLSRRTWQDYEAGKRRMPPALWEYWHHLASGGRRPKTPA